MNQELIYLYRSLNSGIKESLAILFSDSPKTLLLAAFLDQVSESDFKSSKAVNFIYQQEQKEEGLAYSVLVNRYYKLRQTFRQWLIGQLRSNDSYMLPEENELLCLRLLVTKNQYIHAAGELKRLSQRCRADGLYELLPEVERLHLYCLQSSRMHDAEAQAQQLTTLQEAIDWAHQLQQLGFWYMQCFNMQLLPESLAQIRKICGKYPDLPRFQLIYRYTAFFRGVFSSDMNHKSRHVLMRHLNELTALLAEYPRMPIISLSNRERILYNLEVAKMIFFMAGADFSQALQCVYARQKWAADYPFLVESKSLPEYRNYVIVFVANQLYQEALDEARRLFQQLSASPSPNAAHVELAYCYIFGGAVLRPSGKEVETTLRELARLVEELQNQPNLCLEATAARWWLLIVLRRWQEAADWQRQKGWEACVYPMGHVQKDRQFWEELLQALANNDSAAKPTLLQQIQACLPDCPSPWHLYWHKLVELLG